MLVDPENPSNGGGFFDGHESTDFLNSKVIVLWANNVAETSIPDWRIIKEAQAQGATIVSIDPRFTATSAGSDAWLPIRPGTDAALADAMINYIIQHRLYDTAYLQQYTVAPYLVNPKTRKWLRTNDVGLGGDDYVVVDADGKVVPAKGAHRAAAAGHCTRRRAPGADRDAGAGRRRRQVHARLHGLASPTSRPPTSSRWPSSGARPTRSASAPASRSPTGTTAT